MSNFKSRFSKLMLPAILCSLTVLAVPQQSQACFFCVKPAANPNPDQALHINAIETEEQAAQTKQVLQNLQLQMVEKFKNIEAELAANKTEEALTEAKEVLDTVRTKTGIDPKIRIRESFLVSINFPAGAKSMENLDDAQKDQVIRAISDFRGGLYMDLMNLSKRTSLLYIRAFKAEVKKQGGILQDDRNKIINDLVSAALVPMPVEDKAGNKIIAFDEDVANEDHTYMFNRELKMYLIQDPDLKISETDFDRLLQQQKMQILGIAAPNAGAPVDPILVAARICMKEAGDINSYSVETSAEVACFNKFLPRFSSHKDCLEIAQGINSYSSETTAESSCFSKFN